MRRVGSSLRRLGSHHRLVSASSACVKPRTHPPADAFAPAKWSAFSPSVSPRASLPWCRAMSTEAAAGAGEGAGAGDAGDEAPEGFRKWRFAVVWCEDLDKWKDGDQMYVRALSNEATDEPWVTFRAAIAGEVPSEADLAKFDGFVLSGSHYSAYEDLEWIHRLNIFIKGAHTAAEAAKAKAGTTAAVRPKVVAICFGCQAAADALGGRIGTNDDEGSFVLQAEQVTLTEAGRAKPFIDALAAAHDAVEGATDGKAEEGAAASGSAGRGVSLIESHGDRVLELPEGAELLGTSPTAPLEMWSLSDTVLAVQGHPEFEMHHALDIILPTVSENRGWGPEETQATREKLSQPLDHDAFRASFREFLTGGEKWAPK